MALEDDLGLANGMLGAAATSPADRRTLAAAQPDDFSTAISGTELPPARASFAQRFGAPSSSLDWRYELADMDPRDKDLLYRNTASEIEASQGTLARLQHMEGIVNRLHAARTLVDPNTSLSQVITGSIPATIGGRRVDLGGAHYYPGSTKRKMSQPLSAEETAYYDGLFGHVVGDRNSWRAPSNTCRLCTGNESGSVHSGGAPVVARAREGSPRGYERYVQENWTGPWVRQMQGEAPTAQVAAGTLPGTPAGGSTVRPGSSPTVAEGSDGNAMSSLRDSSLAAALMPYFACRISRSRRTKPAATGAR
jgi:hypothetical protein